MPEICAEYRQKHSLLNETGWEKFHVITKSKKRLQHTMNAVKLKSFHTTVQYMYGVWIPHSTKKVLKLDEGNRNDN